MDGYVLLIILYITMLLPPHRGRGVGWIYNIIMVPYIILPLASIHGTKMAYLPFINILCIHAVTQINHIPPGPSLGQRWTVDYVLPHHAPFS